MFQQRHSSSLELPDILSKLSGEFAEKEIDQLIAKMEQENQVMLADNLLFRV